jgi:predicted protein tyrosine phosphatase
MKFVNIPKAVVEFVDIKYPDFVLISITETSSEKGTLRVPSCCKDVLYLQFHDIDKDRENLTLFSRKHAKEILEFFNKYKNKTKNIIIHCTAGISRSAGVAAALYRIYYGENDTNYWSSFMPNMLVYRTILREYYGLGDDEFV